MTSISFSVYSSLFKNVIAVSYCEANPVCTSSLHLSTYFGSYCFRFKSKMFIYGFQFLHCPALPYFCGLLYVPPHLSYTCCNSHKSQLTQCTYPIPCTSPLLAPILHPHLPHTQCTPRTFCNFTVLETLWMVLQLHIINSQFNMGPNKHMYLLGIEG